MAKHTSQPKADAPASEANASPKKTRTSSRAKRPVDPSDDDIRHRAYQRYLERDGTAGSELDDWLQAEQELRRKRR